MFGKVFFVLACLAIVALPLANSLKCWTCGNEISCKNPASVTCDQNYANVTREGMKYFYNGVKDLNSNDFSCILTRYQSNGTIRMDVRGCIMNGAVDCGFQLKNQTWTRDECKVCRTDSCNYKNSVGTFSSSMASVVALMVLAKALIA